MMVQGKQLTVVWHVDDLKVSHVSTAILTNMADWLHSTYQSLFEDRYGEMQISRRKIQEYYLKMTLDITVPGELNIANDPVCYQGHHEASMTILFPFPNGGWIMHGHMGGCV